MYLLDERSEKSIRLSVIQSAVISAAIVAGSHTLQQLLGHNDSSYLTASMPFVQ